jgi:hypothetical protein
LSAQPVKGNGWIDEHSAKRTRLYNCKFFQHATSLKKPTNNSDQRSVAYISLVMLSTIFFSFRTGEGFLPVLTIGFYTSFAA